VVRNCLSLGRYGLIFASSPTTHCHVGQWWTRWSPAATNLEQIRNNVNKVLPKPYGPYAGAHLHFLRNNPQPDTSLHCKTMNMRLVHRTMCLFTSSLCWYPLSWAYSWRDGQNWIDLGGWLHETVYLPVDSHSSKY